MKLFHLILFFVLVSFTAFSAEPDSQAKLKAAQKVSQYVQSQLASNATLPVLVILNEQADLSAVPKSAGRTERISWIYRTLVEQANRTQGTIVKFLKRRQMPHQRFFISNAIAVQSANKDLISTLSFFPEVAKIVGNPSIKGNPLPIDSDISWVESISKSTNAAIPTAGENIVATGANRVWSELKITGKGIVVAGQDTGVQWDHPALKNQYRGWKSNSVNHDYSWHDSIKTRINPSSVSTCGYDSKVPCDDNAHGTHTLGTAVGSDGGANGIGVAPESKFIACRNMDAGWGNPATYLDCFQFFLAPTPVTGDPFTTGRPDLAPHVINNSWGCPPEEGCEGDEMIPALKALYQAGIMVVVSAGNDGPDCGTIKSPPATSTDLSLTVGAYSHRSNTIASFSSRGPSPLTLAVGPSVSAPGVKIRSAIPGGTYADMAGPLSPWSGTSMAGPHVAGQVALMWSANPRLIGKIDETRKIIEQTAKAAANNQNCGSTVANAVPNNTFGHGTIQVFESVRQALQF